jgi:hypothetical protein
MMTPEQAKEILERIRNRADISSESYEDVYLSAGEWDWGNEGDLIPLIMEMCREMRS